MSAGYSKTPLSKKLGIKAGFKALALAAPPHYFDLLAPIPENVTFSDSTASKSSQSFDFIHMFALSKSQLEEMLANSKPLLKKNGSLWVSWPKGTADFPPEQKTLKREPVREAGLSAGLVDIKVAAVDENWSGLKFVYRLEDR